MHLSSLLSPVYPLALVFAIALLAHGLSYLVPFYRRELDVEDRTRLTPLDGLRGILCFAVLCNHALVTYGYLGTGAWQAPPTSLTALLGQAPVALFFCITGFLFWGRVDASAGELAPWPFLRGRVFRLVPLYLFSCLLALAVVAPRIRWASDTTLSGLGSMAMMGLQRWGVLGGVYMFNVNAAVTWTLQYEWGFYFLLPALALIARDPQGPRRLWLFALGLWAIFQPNPTFFFLPGVLAVYAVRRPELVRGLRRWPATIMVLAAVATFPLVSDQSYGYPALALTTLIFIPVAAGNTLFGVLNWRGLRLMGMVSYSVYLLHGACLFAAHPFLGRLKFDRALGAWWYWAGAGVCAGAVLLLSMATYRWIEWPFMQLERRLRRAPARKAPATSQSIPWSDQTPRPELTREPTPGSVANRRVEGPGQAPVSDAQSTPHSGLVPSGRGV